MPRLYSPPETASLVGIAEPTLRVWAKQHRGLLSEYANMAKRQYTARDVAVLQAINELHAGGVKHSDMAAKLSAIKLPAEDAEGDVAQEAARATRSAPSDASAMQLVAVQLSATQADQSQRLTGQDARIADQAEQLADLRERIARLEAEAASLRRDLDAQRRSQEMLGERLDSHEGIMGSVGDKVHWHEGYGRTLSNMKS